MASNVPPLAFCSLICNAYFWKTRNILYLRIWDFASKINLIHLILDEYFPFQNYYVVLWLILRGLLFQSTPTLNDWILLRVNNNEIDKFIRQDQNKIPIWRIFIQKFNLNLFLKSDKRKEMLVIYLLNMNVYKLYNVYFQSDFNMKNAFYL